MCDIHLICCASVKIVKVLLSLWIVEVYTSFNKWVFFLYSFFHYFCFLSLSLFSIEFSLSLASPCQRQFTNTKTNIGNSVCEWCTEKEKVNKIRLNQLKLKLKPLRLTLAAVNMHIHTLFVSNESRWNWKKRKKLISNQ